jgi:hypothetical protein
MIEVDPAAKLPDRENPTCQWLFVPAVIDG